MNLNRLVTPRLDLIPATATLVRAELHDRPRFFRILRVPEVVDWPPPDVVDALPVFLRELEERPTLVGWLAWYWVLRREPDAAGGILVGSGGFKGLPQDGQHQQGYYVREVVHQRGFATEALGALLNWAFAHPRVTMIVAETAKENAASRALLGKLHFAATGQPSEPEFVRYLLRAQTARDILYTPARL